MAQSLSCILIHLIFSTKMRQPLVLPDVRQELHSYMAGISRSQDAFVNEIGGTEDHMHLLVSLPRTLCLSKLNIIKLANYWHLIKQLFMLSDLRMTFFKVLFFNE